MIQTIIDSNTQYKINNKMNYLTEETKQMILANSIVIYDTV